MEKQVKPVRTVKITVCPPGKAKGTNEPRRPQKLPLARELARGAYWVRKAPPSW
jgi:hypothetical protein